jgi:hypothetical protein
MEHPLGKQEELHESSADVVVAWIYVLLCCIYFSSNIVVGSTVGSVPVSVGFDHQIMIWLIVVRTPNSMRCCCVPSCTNNRKRMLIKPNHYTERVHHCQPWLDVLQCLHIILSNLFLSSVEATSVAPDADRDVDPSSEDGAWSRKKGSNHFFHCHTEEKKENDIFFCIYFSSPTPNSLKPNSGIVCS